MPLFLLFVVIPIIEIALFIEIGGRIGLWTTLAIIVVTAAVGSFAIRSQGRAMMRSLSGANMMNVADLMSQGLLLFMAGVFLITPGFLTDIAGLSLLVPPIRRAVRDYLAKRMTFAAVGPTAGARDPRGFANQARSVDDDPPAGARETQASERGAPGSRSDGPPNPNSPWRGTERSDDVEDAQILDEKTPKR